MIVTYLKGKKMVHVVFPKDKDGTHIREWQEGTNNIPDPMEGLYSSLGFDKH